MNRNTNSIQTNLTLDQLKTGDSARIIRLNNKVKGMETTILRLLDLGFVPGQALQVHAEAFPSKDPLAVRIGNSIFALRRCEAALIYVHRENN